VKEIARIVPAMYAVLSALDGAKTLSEVADDTGRAKSTVCQWANMLADLGLIRKSVDGVVYYEVTALGAVLREKLRDVVEFVEVLNQAGNYFSTHDISPVPVDLLEDLRCLKGCRKESLKREILAGFCGYLLWIAVLISGYVEPLNSVVFGYSVELAAILLEWRFLK